MVAAREDSVCLGELTKKRSRWFGGLFSWAGEAGRDREADGRGVDGCHIVEVAGSESVYEGGTAKRESDRRGRWPNLRRWWRCRRRGGRRDGEVPPEFLASLEHQHFKTHNLMHTLPLGPATSSVKSVFPYGVLGYADRVLVRHLAHPL